MRTLQVLTDVYGPRLTGSPNLKGAAEWVVKETTAWGLKNAHLEPWDFGHPGWLNERLSVHVVSPVKDALVAEALAWTPGTNGPVTAQVDPAGAAGAADARSSSPRSSTSSAATVKGKIVLVGKRRSRWRVTIDPPAKRREDSDVRAQFDPAPRRARRSARARRSPPQPPADTDIADRRTRSPSSSTSSSSRAGARRPRQRRRPRARPDPRLQQPHLRHRQGGADRRDAQRGLRPHLAADRRRPRRSSSSSNIVNQVYPEGTHAVQRRRRDSRAPTRPTRS